MWSWCVFVSICDLNHEALWLCPGPLRLSGTIRGNKFWHSDGHERHHSPANKATCHIRPSCLLPAGLWNVVHPLSFLIEAILQIQGQRLLNFNSPGRCKTALSMWNMSDECISAPFITLCSLKQILKSALVNLCPEWNGETAEKTYYIINTIFLKAL